MHSKLLTLITSTGVTLAVGKERFPSCTFELLLNRVPCIYLGSIQTSSFPSYDLCFAHFTLFIGGSDGTQCMRPGYVLTWCFLCKSSFLIRANKWTRSSFSEARTCFVADGIEQLPQLRTCFISPLRLVICSMLLFSRDHSFPYRSCSITWPTWQGCLYCTWTCC